MGTLSFLNGKFFFDAHSRAEGDDAHNAGLAPCEETLRWVTRSAVKARALRRFADDSAERKLRRYFITDLAPPECIVYPDHRAPRSWQIESAWHALTRTPCYIADEAGLGKSATAILAINSSPGKALIVCPPYLKYNWIDEFRTWSTSKLEPVVIEDSAAAENEALFEDNDLLILPDSLLTNEAIQARLAEAGPFKWLIVDEFHRFKTGDAQRTVALLGDTWNDKPAIVDQCERLVFLSGTPIPNGKPIELYPQISRVAFEAIGHRSLEDFGREFCAGRRVTRFERGHAIVNWDFSGASNLKLLRRELREKLMTRHLKRDCLTELGPKTRQLIFLDTPKKILKLEEKELAHFQLSDLLGNMARLGDIAKYRKEVGLAKLDQAAEYIADLLESSEEKIVVGAYHIEVVEGLVKKLKAFHPLKIRGGVSAKEKHTIKNLFQNSKKHRVIVGNTLSMGLGFTFTRAPFYISVEPEWTPGVNEQMEDRIHRMSQEKHVFCRYLVLRNSLDERMLRQALDKETNIHTVMN